MKFIKKTDFIIIAALLIAGLLSWGLYSVFANRDSLQAEIYYYSELVKTVRLDQNIESHFSIEEEPDVVFYLSKDGSIRFEESDCPDKICINTGALSLSGQFAACLPNGLVIKITGGNESDEADIILGTAGAQ